MLIPVRCFTCNEVLGDKWIPYVTEVQKRKNSSNEIIDDTLDLKYIDVKQKNSEKSIEGQVLDDLNLHKYCCRRMMLTNVHLISYTS
tara:strand:- start:1102 stop:1362 length:261 start_codon:yes stop_codon:yes gene_type:complete